MRAVAICAVLMIGTFAHAGGPSQAAPIDPAKQCKRHVLAKTPRADLKMIGKVNQGKTKKVLLMSRDNIGHIIKPGDCVGIERVPFDEYLNTPLPEPRTKP